MTACSSSRINWVTKKAAVLCLENSMLNSQAVILILTNVSSKLYAEGLILTARLIGAFRAFLFPYIQRMGTGFCNDAEVKEKLFDFFYENGWNG